MFGKILLEEFDGLTKLPQEYASAFTAATEKIVGADYKPLLCLGKQQVNGKNFYFIAEQTLVTNPPLRRIVKLVINSLNGKHEIISVEEVI